MVEERRGKSERGGNEGRREKEDNSSGVDHTEGASIWKKLAGNDGAVAVHPEWSGRSEGSWRRRRWRRWLQRRGRLASSPFFFPLTHAHGPFGSQCYITGVPGPRKAQLGCFTHTCREQPPALARPGRCFCAKFSTNKAPRRRRIATPTPPFQARTTGIFPLSRVINERRRPGPPSVGGGSGGGGRQNPSTTTTTQLPPPLPPPPPALVGIILGYVPEDIPT